MSDARSLRKQFNRMLATLLVALAAAGAVTYAWYIYNANRHITDVKMAAGTGVTFLISNEYDGEYKTNAGLSFTGLLDPVSTDNVLNGFQKVTGFTGGTTQDSLFASMFGAAEHSDYYKTSLYLATNSAATDVYLSGIDFTEQDPANPISTALRVGLVTYASGQGDTVTGQYVFEVSGEHNPQARYNTLDGKDAGESEQNHLVLDSTRSDGATVHFDQLTSANFCDYNEDTGVVSLKEATTKICSLPAAAEAPIAARPCAWMCTCGWKAATPTAPTTWPPPACNRWRCALPVSVRKGARDECIEHQRYPNLASSHGCRGRMDVGAGSRPERRHLRLV